jgi:hypothetical protein
MREKATWSQATPGRGYVGLGVGGGGACRVGSGSGRSAAGAAKTGAALSPVEGHLRRLGLRPLRPAGLDTRDVCRILQTVPRPVGVKGFVILPKRRIVERTFPWLSQSRRLRNDHERLPETTETFIYIRMIQLMSRRLAKHRLSIEKQALTREKSGAIPSRPIPVIHPWMVEFLDGCTGAGWQARYGGSGS